MHKESCPIIGHKLENQINQWLQRKKKASCKNNVGQILKWHQSSLNHNAVVCQNGLMHPEMQRALHSFTQPVKC